MFLSNVWSNEYFTKCQISRKHWVRMKIVTIRNRTITILIWNTVEKQQQQKENKADCRIWTTDWAVERFWPVFAGVAGRCRCGKSIQVSVSYFLLHTNIDYNIQVVIGGYKCIFFFNGIGWKKENIVLSYYIEMIEKIHIKKNRKIIE